MRSGEDYYTYRGAEDHVHDRIAIIMSKWNVNVVAKLKEGAYKVLINAGVKTENISLYFVPGSYELPMAAQYVGANYDAIICLGCVIKGDTKHNEYISQAVADGIMRVALRLNRPIIFGVLTTENEAQALERAGGSKGNKGEEAAVAALDMIDFKLRFLPPL